MITGKKAMMCATRFFRTNNAKQKEIFEYIIGHSKDGRGKNVRPLVNVCVGIDSHGHKIFEKRPVRVSKMYRKMIRSGRLA